MTTTATQQSTVGPVGAEIVVPGSDWIALHIFYASNPNPMLVDCIEPLARELRRSGLIQRYFFIRYWQEGPHIRLRLLPAPGVEPARVERQAREVLAAFLVRRPALFALDVDQVEDYHRDMFVFEYGEEEWESQYGSNGMPVRENNTVVRLPYEPEYDRYGGPVGVALAEWHFERSSDMVTRLVSSANVHVRTVMFGLSAQLTLVMALIFRPGGADVSRFLHYYSEFWLTAYPDNAPGDPRERFDTGYDEVADVLRERVTTVSAAVLQGRSAEVSTFLRDWIEHCTQLRSRVETLAARGDLVFQARIGAEEAGEGPVAREPIRDPDVALGILLSGYVHMTNNRLGVGIHDEAYLAHVLRRAVMEVHGVHPDELAIVP